MPKTVYLHVGSGKTGTSAIQVALVRNRELLARYGLVYPEVASDARALRGMTTSGNGSALRGIWYPEVVAKISENAGLRHRDRGLQTLRNTIRARDRATAEVASADLRKLIDNNAGHSLVFSSEGLARLSPDALKFLCEFFQSSGLQVKIIYYVRHLMDLALSAYNQAVKGQVYTRDFMHFLKRHRSPYKDVIETFSSVVGRRNFILRLYDRERPNLIGGFVDLLFQQEGVSGEGALIFSDKEEIVNRSLTREESDIMRFVNNLLTNVQRDRARKICKRVSNGILHDVQPTEVVRAAVTAAEMRILQERNRDILQFVNDFAGKDFGLKLKSDNIVIGRRLPPNRDGSDAVYRTVIASLIDRIDAGQPSVDGIEVRPNITRDERASVSA